VGTNLDQHQMTGSLSSREKLGNVITTYISEEQYTDTYRMSDDSVAGNTN